jgi:hypothetical protein
MPHKALDGSEAIRTALRLVGELLQARALEFHIVVIGGAAVNLQGFVSRTTTDVDILAFARPGPEGVLQLMPPAQPLPRGLMDAARTVAADLNLDPEWLNAGPALQWQTGLPPGLGSRVHWVDYGALKVGLADRTDLIYFKLYAAADQTGPLSVHFQDLLALLPTEDELRAAAEWVRQQDPSVAVATTLTKVFEHVRTLRSRPR